MVQDTKLPLLRAMSLVVSAIIIAVNRNAPCRTIRPESCYGSLAKSRLTRSPELCKDGPNQEVVRKCVP